MSITLPISYGEAFDKLSILEIKLKNITDDRRNDVQVEYDILYNELKQYLEQIDYHYKILVMINTEIWYSMDKIRTIDEKVNQDEWIAECKKTIIDNDRRFRVKHKINYLLSSHLKEQKGYIKRRAFISNECNNNGLIRYYSTLYDEVLVQTSNNSIEYIDDQSIKLVPTYIDDDVDIITLDNQLNLDENTIRKYYHVALYPV